MHFFLFCPDASSSSNKWPHLQTWFHLKQNSNEKFVQFACSVIFSCKCSWKLVVEVNHNPESLFRFCQRYFCMNLFCASFWALESSSVSPAQLPRHKSRSLSPVYVGSPPSKQCSLNAVVLGSKRLPACLPLPRSCPSPSPAEPGTLGLNASILLV